MLSETTIIKLSLLIALFGFALIFMFCYYCNKNLESKEEMSYMPIIPPINKYYTEDMDPLIQNDLLSVKSTPESNFV